MEIPPIDLRLETTRLIIEPVLKTHAAIMVDVVSNPQLYQFIPLDPPSLDKLQQRYKRWETRISPTGNEIWLNWVARLKNGAYIGDFQAGYKQDGIASIAYMLALPYHGQGYAAEGLTKIISMLFDDANISTVKAWIDTRNKKSIALMHRLGLQKVDEINKADHFKGTDSDEFVFAIDRADWFQRAQ